MLTAALIMTLVLVLFMAYGWGIVQGLQKVVRIPQAGNLRPAMYILAGMCVLIWAGQMFSLVMPLAAGAFLIVLAVGLWIVVRFFQSGQHTHFLPKPLPTLGVILLGLIFLSVLENSTHAATNPDTGIYHAQAIRWIETYPVVSGLGNLHTRFAFNSSWLVLNAMFSLSFLGVKSFHLVPAALTLTVAFDCAQGALDWLRGKGTFANILRALLLPLIFFVLGSQISSPGTDLPVILILWLLLAAWLDRTQDQSEIDPMTSYIIFIAAVSLVTIKLSAAPVLLLALWLGLINLRKPPVLLKLAALTVIILFPWMVRNVILSGYVIYPFPAINIFNVDWKIPIEIAKSEVETIQAWGRDPGESVEAVMARPFFSWLRIWFIEKTTNQKVILLAAATSGIILGAGLLAIQRLKVKARLDTQPILTGYAAVTAGAVYWLMSAPDIRFGYGFLLAMVALAAVPWLNLLDILASSFGKFIRVGLILGLIAYQLFFFVRSFDAKTIGSRLILPADYPSLPSEPCALGEGQVWCAGAEAWTQCWYDPFPCIPQVNDWAEQRGPEWKDGFRPIEKMP